VDSWGAASYRSRKPSSVRVEQDDAALAFVSTYDAIAARIGPAGAVCELGVNRGISLTMWLERFPDGIVVGVDNQESCVWPEGTIKVVCSQVDPNLSSLVRRYSPAGYDLVIDDCSHEARLTKASWEMLWPIVRPGGFYVIEDWELGFPSSPLHYAFGDANVVMAKNFIDLLDYPGKQDIDSIEYRYGMIVLRKAVR
jgi:hypothetical protein